MLLLVFKKTWMKNEREKHVMLSYGFKYLDMPCGKLYPLSPTVLIPVISAVTKRPGLLWGTDEFL